MAYTYKCRKCNKGFRVSDKHVNSCKYCGSEDVYCKSLETAKEQIDRCNELVDKINKCGQEYSKLLGEYQMLTRNLNNYSRRGFIDKNDIPKYIYYKASDGLISARKNNKK